MNIQVDGSYVGPIAGDDLRVDDAKPAHNETPAAVMRGSRDGGYPAGAVRYWSAGTHRGRPRTCGEVANRCPPGRSR